MLTRILALIAVLLLAPSTLAHANARALSLESASPGIFAGNVGLLKEIPELTHCCIKEKSTEQAESSNRREEYLRARYMDPAQGRFLGMDAWGGAPPAPVTLHKYLYANSEPVTTTDPSGRLGIISVTGTTLVHSSSRIGSVKAGVTTVTKFTAELAFEYATGIPVFTNPKNFFSAISSIKSSISNLPKTGVWKLIAGNQFERGIKELWSLTKNTSCFKNGVAVSLTRGCFIPDFFVKRTGQLVEVKTTAAAVREDQFKEFMLISAQTKQPMTFVFQQKPTAAEIQMLQNWAIQVAGPTEDVLLKIVHVLD